MDSGNRIWTRNFILICIANFFVFTSFQMLMPVVPFYVEFLGGDRSIVGFIVGAFTLSAVVSRPLIGRELDRRGRAGIYLLGLVTFTAVAGLYHAVRNLVVLTLLRLVHGIGWGTTSTAAGTIVADILPAKRRAEGMGYYGMFGTLAMAIAPAVGLHLMRLYGFGPVFEASACLAVVAILAAAFLRLPVVRAEPGDKAALYEPRALYPSVVVFFMAMTYGGLVTFLALYAEEKGIMNIGPYFTIYAATLMVSRPLAGMVADSRGARASVIPGLIFVTLAMITLAAADSMATFLLAGVFMGFGFGATQPTLAALVVTGVAPSRRGAANGTFFSAFDLGIGTGSMALGVVARFAGYETMYITAAGIGLWSLLLFLLGWEKWRMVESQRTGCGH